LSTPREAYDAFFDAAWPPNCPSSYGSGAFGQWVVDANGQPAYDYRIDQLQNPDARYFTSDGFATDHWHLVGNDRVSATAHNGGYVQLYEWSRGGKLLNRWEPERHNYAGGFKFITANNKSWSTLWKTLPPEAVQQRLFGMGWFEKTTAYRGLLVRERIEAPAGDDPVLLSTTTVLNQSDAPQEVEVVEYWDVNLHQLTAAPLMTHGLGRLAEDARSFLNSLFVMHAGYEPEPGILRIEFAPLAPHAAPPPSAPAFMDHHPKSIFLSALDPLPDGFSAFAVDQDLFFGDAPIQATPPGLRGAADGRLFKNRTAYRGGAMLSFRRAQRLAPGESVTWRYLYGTAPPREQRALAEKFRDRPRLNPRPLAGMVVPEAPWLGRELAWHSYYLQAGAVYDDFLGAHFVDQGSAYAFLQGFSGAPRDFALFVLALTYLRPDLAKETLRFMMMSQDAADGALPYLRTGFGLHTGMLIHELSSDLDLFLLWAIGEYLAATQDLDFLAEQLPFYPPAAGVTATVMDHLRAALRHLTTRVGLGPHGMLRCGTGDWNDVLIAFSDAPLLTVWHGESALNAALTTVALPLLAETLTGVAPDFADDLTELADGQAAALRAMWTGEWAARGYLGHGDAQLGVDQLFLDAQPFGLLGGVWTDEQAQRLLARIDEWCVEPQPVGALSLWPPLTGPFLDPGSDTNGGTWAAIDGWLAWAWSDYDPAAAWDFYLRSTLAAHAEAYPRVWYGVWSGPDSYNSDRHPRPGETFNYTFTPMTDYPVMNMNRHASPLFAAIKLAGIRPRDGAIVIDPHVPFDSFALRLPLLGVAYLPDRCRGYYTPVTDDTFTFAVRPPAGAGTLMVNGQVAAFAVKDGRWWFTVPGRSGKRIVWEMQ
jgi:hypothetical protein